MLDGLVALYATRSEAAPEEQFVTTGPVALDCCETLAVSVGRIFLGLPANPQPGDGLIRGSALEGATSVELTIVAARIIPTIERRGDQPVFPTAAQITASAIVTATDAWLLTDGIREVVRDGVFEPCSDVAIGDVVPLDNAGGFGGFEARLVVQL